MAGLREHGTNRRLVLWLWGSGEPPAGGAPDS